MKFKIQKRSLNLKKQNNLILFVDSELKVKGLENSLLDKNLYLINKTISLNKNKIKDFFSFDLNTNLKITLIKIDSKSKNFKNSEKIGAKFFEYIKSNSLYETSILSQNIKLFSKIDDNFFDKFIFGISIKSYQFDIYKTKKDKKSLILNIDGNFKYNFHSERNEYWSLVEGIKLTKNLVSEPGNILHPDEYAKRILKLKSFGLKVTILNKKKLKKLGMHALLGVGQGSIRGSYLAIIEWNGSNEKQKPLAFVGKGVCFDTGGISLKPAKFMEDMTYDMAGSAVVVGLMKTLALRKAKVNAVGVVGLVENMPDGNAQRPGDIVKSYSGKTIEILNTDAEGRLVLADALSYTEQKFKPKFIVDLATLTGAIIVSLGSEYAGLFSNDNKISEQ